MTTNNKMQTFTFFAPKGGAGQTTLIKHLACHWARQGKVVAVIDMGFNALGLSYHSWLQCHHDPPHEERGASDLMSTFYALQNTEKGAFGFFPPSKLLREALPPKQEDRWETGGRLLVLPAGTTRLPIRATFDDVTKRVISSNKRELLSNQSVPDSPERKALEGFAYLFRQDLIKYRTPEDNRPIDYLIIDCCTGYPDLADLTMGFLADKIVLVSALNQQSLEGLRLTLAALKPERLPPGTLSTDLITIFSLIPALIQDSPEVVAAFTQGKSIIEKARRHLHDSGKLEDGPSVHTSPYASYLAITDLLAPSRAHPGWVSPYWESVKQIASNAAIGDKNE